ncbi:hypothetical protein J0S82_011620, partial [Galemys pyrenaicus]
HDGHQWVSSLVEKRPTDGREKLGHPHLTLRRNHSSLRRLDPHSGFLLFPRREDWEMDLMTIKNGSLCFSQEQWWSLNLLRLLWRIWHAGEVWDSGLRFPVPKLDLLPQKKGKVNGSLTPRT